MKMNEIKDPPSLTQAEQCLVEHRLKDAIAHVKAFMADNQYLHPEEDVERIEKDYALMLDYMLRGFADNQRQNIYLRLMQRLFRCLQNLRVEYKKRQATFYIEAQKRAASLTISGEAVRSRLEAFVADLAMLSLEDDDTRQDRSAELHRRQQELMTMLFCRLATDRQWTSGQSDFYEQLLLSPTIDTGNAQVLVSAVSLSAMNDWDAMKIRTLIHVYQKSGDEHVRQRALVGWALSFHNGQTIFPEVAAWVEEACQSEQTVRELTELQKQMVFCMNADRDNDRIQRDIMPTLMKNSNLNITRQGIISEKDEDPMEDILDPGAADRRMEEMEEGIQKMMNMQKQGADIYFGGFSQMKRFPFFYNPANWFTPFYLEHPGIAAVVKKLQGRKFLVFLFENGPFCDSDKYSFALAMNTVVDRLPENMLSLLDNAEAMGPTAPPEEQQTAAYIRRMYLQDLYRFFRICPQLGGLRSPFDNERFVFAAYPELTSTPLKKHFADLCQFFRKQKNNQAFNRLAPQYADDGDSASLLVRAMYWLDRQQPGRARQLLEGLIAREPDHERGRLLLARACFTMCDYAAALDHYGALHTINPENQGYALNYSLALCKMNRYGDAAALLFKLDYENPGQPSIQRMLAWALMGQKKLEQAEKLWQQLLAADNPEAGDFLNAGYCAWADNRVGEAVERFRLFLEKEETRLEQEFENDKELLAIFGITKTDMMLMQDLVSGNENE